MANGFVVLSIAYKYDNYKTLKQNSTPKNSKKYSEMLISIETLILAIHKVFKAIQVKKKKNLDKNVRAILLQKLYKIYINFNKEIISQNEMESKISDLIAEFHFLTKRKDIALLYSFKKHELHPNTGKIIEPKEVAKIKLGNFIGAADSTLELWEENLKKDHFTFNKYDPNFLKMSLIKIFDVDQETASRITLEITSSDSYRKKSENPWSHIEKDI